MTQFLGENRGSVAAECRPETHFRREGLITVRWLAWKDNRFDQGYIVRYRSRSQSVKEKQMWRGYIG